MMFSPLDIHFHYPKAAFLLLLLFPLLAVRIIHHRAQKECETSFTSPSLLNRLLVPRSPLIALTKNVFWFLILTLLILSLMEPVSSKKYHPTS